MIIKLYPKEDGFTAEEIRRGFHTLYMDLKCPKCQKEQSFANYKANCGCVKCGYYEKE